MSLRPDWTAALLCVVCICLSATPSHATIDDITDWRYQQLRWFDRGGLPVDNEFAAPLTAGYNWAYGAVVLGVTARRTGSSDYYAVLAIDDRSRLSAYDTLGPFTAPPQLHGGRYHLAVAQPDGRVMLWLTAPGADPKRLWLVNDACPGAPVACIAIPPDPPGTKWAEWSIILAYCLDTEPPYLDVSRYNGNGKVLGQIFGAALPGTLDAVAINGRAGGAPQLLFSVVEPQARAGAQTSVYVSALGSNGWYTQRITAANRRGVVLHPGAAGSWATAIAAADESSVGFFMHSVGYATLESGMQPLVTGSEYFSARFSRNCISLFESTRYLLPVMAYTDGPDLALAWCNGDALHSTAQAGLTRFRLHTLETDARGYALYGVAAVAGTAHWSTGDPAVYWVQQGSIDNETGQLFCMAYSPDVD